MKKIILIGSFIILILLIGCNNNSEDIGDVTVASSCCNNITIREIKVTNISFEKSYLRCLNEDYESNFINDTEYFFWVDYEGYNNQIYFGNDCVNTYLYVPDFGFRMYSDFKEIKECKLSVKITLEYDFGDIKIKNKEWFSERDNPYNLEYEITKSIYGLIHKVLD